MSHSAKPPTRTARASRRTRRLVTALAVLAPLVAVTAVQSSALADDAPRAKEQAESPFTGLPADPAPVLAVKVDNVKAARPHTALEKADMVFVEKVEGGLSRLIGVFSSEQPEEIGPVRSAREYNVEQLRMFDRPALAYSGAQKGVDDLIQESPLYGLSNDNFPGAYFRDDSRDAPHNLFVHPDEILAGAPEASDSSDIGFRFGDDAPEGGEPLEERTVSYPSADTTFNWSAEEDRWLASFDGEPATSTDGERLGGKTVVVQEADMPLSEFQDPTNTTPFIETVDKGKATVLRDGKAYETTWERTSPEGDTTYTLPNGERMPFDRGQVWVVYEERK
ncbi:DUF3048 domain-containing protein [Streptomyces phytohabitans]|uniref:DUF3048 domain-containing protein n=1 Tax=Streptomyces phytohabitans TaxID=1150371 RepID=UPI00345B5198